MKRSSAPSQANNANGKKFGRFVPPTKGILKPVPENTCTDVSFSNQLPNSSTTPSDGEMVKQTASTFKPPTSVRPVNLLASSTHSKSADIAGPPKYFSVVWCKRSNKKHKKWEGDAVLIVKGRSVSLVDTDGKEIGKSSGYKLDELASLKEGETLGIGAKQIEILGVISEESYLSGKCFSNAHLPTEKVNLPIDTSFKTHCIGKSLFLNSSSAAPKTADNSRTLTARFDPTRADALVLSRPPESMKLPVGVDVVDVVVDPYISHKLRPHQREGVDFLYQCVMGYRNISGRGAILADEMGLGKTVQVIALLWTLLKQNPVSQRPVIKRALIVTPGSLVKNWLKEFKKWLGTERLQVFAVGGDKKAQDFKDCILYPVMIISYEMLVRCVDNIKQSNFDILVCDEGHRLKNNAIKTTQSLQFMNIDRRIVVTGTPLQNDLTEFFSLVNFCIPSLLGSEAAFHQVYEKPILASKQPNCSAEERGVGEERAKELNKITSSFILRRTNEINCRYLPPKHEYIVFCKPSDRQVALYRKWLDSCQLSALLNYQGDAKPHLVWINDLKKLCNHPSLLAEYEHSNNNTCITESQDSEDLYLLTPPKLQQAADNSPCSIEGFVNESGKLLVLYNMLVKLKDSCGNFRLKMVVVSNYTTTLDLLEKVCTEAGHLFLRLDGQTPVSKRQKLVDQFNSSSSNQSVFLLSSKAGGVGLNLVGANRLVLYDIDWNPANDLQAMARIWRDGQRHPVFIYRLLTAGTIEEKIYQRQLSKQNLGNSIVDNFQESEVQFSKEDLKDLFVFRPDTTSETHDMLACNCLQTQPPSNEKQQKLSNREHAKSSSTLKVCRDVLNTWRHIPSHEIHLEKDELLAKHIPNITFVFSSRTTQAADANVSPADV